MGSKNIGRITQYHAHYSVRMASTTAVRITNVDSIQSLFGNELFFQIAG